MIRDCISVQNENGEDVPIRRTNVMCLVLYVEHFLSIARFDEFSVRWGFKKKRSRLSEFGQTVFDLMMAGF